MKLQKKIGAAARLLKSRGLAIAAIFVLFSGLVGFLVENMRDGIQPTDGAAAAKLAVHSFIQTLKLFSLDLSSRPLAENWFLVVARFVGATVAVVAVWRTIASLFGREFAVWRASFLSGHTAVLGHGQRNAHFARSARTADDRSASIILDHDRSAMAHMATAQRAVLLEADLNHSEAIAPARVEKARLVLIGSGSDERNLALAQAVLRRRAAAEARDGRIVLTIDDPAMAETLARQPAIAQPGRGDELAIFNADALAARLLLARTPFSDLALAAGQSHVHLLFAGFSSAALEVLLHYLRLSPCAGLGPSRISVLTGNAEAARETILARVPNLALALEDGLAASDPAANVPLAWATRLRIVAADPSVLSWDAALLDRLAEWGPFTATIFASQNVLNDARLALALNTPGNRGAGLAVPFFVRMDKRSSLETLFRRLPGRMGKDGSACARLSEAVTPGEAIEPFGLFEDICNLDAIFGAREALARRLHETYRLKNFGEGASADLPALAPWERLAETWRIASRRSADYLPVKRLSAGLAAWRDVTDGPALPPEIVEDPGRLEALARLEHDSWRIDRELNGWRFAERRDDDRLLHPHLVGYDALPDDVKDYDREMVRALTRR
ncbi:hypothetical protein HHL25_14225 [Rhizobium sp. S-51]|uniref:Ryanodine receptor Ryr domain-containing protein n=1 Tax=Rhizobium terricola TaxID=2728849 RepID=A0A7Y0FX43_9HYPH|nr:hypothetical protein [Rhizobium terricola]